MKNEILTATISTGFAWDKYDRPGLSLCSHIALDERSADTCLKMSAFDIASELSSATTLPPMFLDKGSLATQLCGSPHGVICHLHAECVACAYERVRDIPSLVLV